MDGTTTKYLVNGSTVIAQQTGSNILWFLYDSDGTRVGFTYNGTAYYYTKNSQGDVTGIVDGNCNTVVEYSYDAWGKLLSTTGSLANTVGKANPFLYRGYYYDTETGLYYLNSRYYDPMTGRFISEDEQFNPQTGVIGNNLFAYCNNNPISMIDSDGTLAAELYSGGGGSSEINVVASNKQVYRPKNDAMDPNSPPPPSTGYKPPKNSDKARRPVTAPGGRGDKGWLDKSGNVWVPDATMDGGAGWRRHYPDGSHDHVYPDGHLRSHNFEFQPPSQETISSITTGAMFVLGVIILIATGNPSLVAQSSH